MPADFGLIGMLSIFISLSQILIDSGLTSALIRKESADYIDYSTVFYMNVVISAILYLVLFFTSPLIAGFFGQPMLEDIIKVLCTVLIINAFSSVQNTVFEKQLRFKQLLTINIPSIFVGGLVGVFMAFRGFGVWSLVFMQIATSITNTVCLWIMSDWKPAFLFSFKRLKEHYKFGLNLTVSGLLDSFFSNIFSLAIGKFFSPAQLGFYSRAVMLKQLPVTNIAGALNKVSYPIFATIQHDSEKLRSAYKRIMMQVVFWVAPLLIIMAVVAEPLFRCLFTEKWLPAVPYFQLLCVEGIMYPLNAYNLNVLKVKGRSDLFLKLEIFKKILAVVCLFFVLRYGIYGLLYFQIAAAIVSYFINSYFTGRFINYGLLEQVKDVLPCLLSAVFTGIFCYIMIHQIDTLSDVMQLLITGVSGIIFYQGLSYVSKSSAQADFHQIISQRVRFRVRPR